MLGMRPALSCRVNRRDRSCSNVRSEIASASRCSWVRLVATRDRTGAAGSGFGLGMAVRGEGAIGDFFEDATT